MATKNNKALLYPRRKTVESEESEVAGRKPVVLDAEAVSQLFHLPLREASERVGICVTSLKRMCRRLGIDRWPYTKPLTGSSSQELPSSALSAPGPKYAGCVLSATEEEVVKDESTANDFKQEMDFGHSIQLSAGTDEEPMWKLKKPTQQPALAANPLFGGLEPGNDRPVVTCTLFSRLETIDVKTIGEPFAEVEFQPTVPMEDADSFTLVRNGPESTMREPPSCQGGVDVQTTGADSDSAFQPCFSSFAGDGSFLTWYLADGEI